MIIVVLDRGAIFSPISSVAVVFYVKLLALNLQVDLWKRKFLHIGWMQYDPLGMKKRNFLTTMVVGC